MDYCDCGNVATFRCGCGVTTCENHQYSSGSALSHFSGMAYSLTHNSEAPAGLAALYRALAEAGSAAGPRVCITCFSTALTGDVAVTAAILSASPWNTAEQMVAVLVNADCWSVSGVAGFGRLVLVAAGKDRPWMSDEPMVAVTQAFAHRFTPAPKLPLFTTEYKNRYTRKAKSWQVQTNVINAWVVPYHSEGAYRHIIIGERGAFSVNFGSFDTLDSAFITGIAPDQINAFFSGPGQEGGFYWRTETEPVARGILGFR